MTYTRRTRRDDIPNYYAPPTQQRIVISSQGVGIVWICDKDETVYSDIAFLKIHMDRTGHTFRPLLDIRGTETE